MNWIPYDKQKPTREDANSDGDVLWRCAEDQDGCSSEPWDTEWSGVSDLYWCSIPDYPGAKSKEERDLSEFELWWFEESGLTGDTESRQAAEKAWLAARKR